MRKFHGKPVKREDESPRFRVRRSGFSFGLFLKQAVRQV